MEIEGVKLKQKRKVDNLREAEDNAHGEKSLGKLMAQHLSVVATK